MLATNPRFHISPHRIVAKLSGIFAVALALIAQVSAAEVFEITPSTRPQIDGKEVDWIDGDFVLRNDQIIVVIGRPVATRDANMTVRFNGAGIIDLTRLDAPSDQLSAFYPTTDRFRFEDESLMEFGQFEGGVFWKCKSSVAADKSLTGQVATIEYRLGDADPFVTVKSSVDASASKTETIDQPAFGVRADRTFRFDTFSVGVQKVAFFCDEFFRQSYLITCDTKNRSINSWSDARARVLSFSGNEGGPASSELICRFYPAGSLVDGVGLLQGGAAQTIRVGNLVGVDPRVRLAITSANASQLAGLDPKNDTSWYADASGFSVVHLPPGEYQVTASAIGHTSVEASLRVTSEPAEHKLDLGSSSMLTANVVDQAGKAIPFKMTIYGADGTPNPDFGPDTTDGSIQNCVYETSGSVVRALPAGQYECIFSHGPEYDAVVREISLAEAGKANLEIVLRRVVDTQGWISAELHSHSSPSGDNTSSQLGRVQNLICEHLEFAPCTEHQRIDSYQRHLEALNMQAVMATCTGMELTGGPLPLNHQNAFPLIWHPHKQHGGAPLVDGNPVTQIQRLAMWDDNSEKVVQINHPNLSQMARDKDLDGKDDGGFSEMFNFVDIIEIHPPEDIFLDPTTLSKDDLSKNRMHQWMRLMKEGRFIPGVVNTDAHYNWHGSGWLRNWIRSTSDDPATIDTDQMTHHLEEGRVIMSTGPFMTVELQTAGLTKPAEIGDTVTLTEGDCTLDVTVQCPNWLDVNRVDVFINGQRQADLSCIRREQPQFFSNDVVRFQRRIDLRITEDSIVIVAAIGEGLSLGRVMGEEFGKLPPVVVSNPIFVKVKE